MNFIAKTATVLGDVSIGNDSSIWFGAVVRGDMNKITIGEGTNIQDNAVLHTSLEESLEIGNHVLVGHGAVVHCKSIGNNTLIGINATVLHGANIGNNCIIAAGSLVPPNKEIPDNSVVMGLPGKVVRQATEEDKKEILQYAKEYVELAKKHLEGKHGQV